MRASTKLVGEGSVHWSANAHRAAEGATRSESLRQNGPLAARLVDSGETLHVLQQGTEGASSQVTGQRGDVVR